MSLRIGKHLIPALAFTGNCWHLKTLMQASDQFNLASRFTYNAVAITTCSPLSYDCIGGKPSINTNDVVNPIEELVHQKGIERKRKGMRKKNNRYKSHTLQYWNDYQFMHNHIMRAPA